MVASTHLPPFTWSYNVRPARLSDCIGIGFAHTEAFRFSSFTNMLLPHRFLYLMQNLRICASRARMRVLSPRDLVFVAHPENREEEIIGFAMFTREGSDEGARRLIQERDSWKLWFLRGYYKAVDWIYELFYPVDRLRNAENWAEFLLERRRIEGEIWVGPKWETRWQCNGLIVIPGWQRRGVGQALMKAGLDMARAEGLPMTLEATTEGEHLYKALGFKLLTPYQRSFEKAGGMMYWYPEGLESEKDVEVQIEEGANA